jgi:hypothetical protein
MAPQVLHFRPAEAIVNHKNRDERDTPCPRCGMDAQWSVLNPEGTRVEILCPDCGSFEMDRSEFDQFSVDLTDWNEPEPR